jgi:hypothetical protein
MRQFERLILEASGATHHPVVDHFRPDDTDHPSVVALAVRDADQSDALLTVTELSSVADKTVVHLVFISSQSQSFTNLCGDH